jgi:hypothetical protein
MEPRNRFRGIDSASLCSLWQVRQKGVAVPVRQDGNRFIASFKGLQIRALLIMCMCMPVNGLNNSPPPFSTHGEGLRQASQ